MADNTLFGRGIGTFVPKEGSTQDTFVDKRTLPLPINPKILDNLSDFERSLIYTVANSTATLQNGTRIPYAVNFREIDQRKFYFDVAMSSSDGREAIFVDIVQYGKTLAKIVTGEHEDFWEDGEQFDDWRERATNYLDSDLTLERYVVGVKLSDDILVQKAEKKELSWKDVAEALETGSYVARRFVKKGVDELVKEFDSFRGLEKRVKVIERGDTLNRQPIVIAIDDLYIGGVRYDKGAASLAKLVEKDIERLDDDNDDFNCMEAEESVRDLYHTLRFLEMQGYGAVAQPLREKLTSVFIGSFHSYVEYIGDISPVVDKLSAMYATRCFLETAKATDEPAVYSAIVTKTLPYRPIFEETAKTLTPGEDRGNFIYLQKAFAEFDNGK